MHYDFDRGAETDSVRIATVHLTAPKTELPRIIIAEDDSLDAELLKITLAAMAAECSVATFGNGAELIDFLRRAIENESSRALPVALLLDLHLPQVDGFGVIAWIRQRPELRHLKIIVQSGSDARSDAERAIALGASEFLPKPADPAALRTILGGVISIRGDKMPVV